MGKNILIFADGTGQAGGLKPDQTLSNVYKLFRATRVGPDNNINPAEQVAFYDPGLGTEKDEGQIPFRSVQKFGKFWSAATGTGISRNYCRLLRSHHQTLRARGSRVLVRL